MIRKIFANKIESPLMEHLKHYNSAQPDQPVLFRKLEDIVNPTKVNNLYSWLTGQKKHKPIEEIFVYFEENESESMLAIKSCYPYEDNLMHRVQGDDLDVIGMGLFGDLMKHNKINGYYVMTFTWNDFGRNNVKIRPLKARVPSN
jgi:hypothetical protein